MNKATHILDSLNSKHLFSKFKAGDQFYSIRRIDCYIPKSSKAPSDEIVEQKEEFVIDELSGLHVNGLGSLRVKGVNARRETARMRAECREQTRRIMTEESED